MGACVQHCQAWCLAGLIDVARPEPICNSHPARGDHWYAIDASMRFTCACSVPSPQPHPVCLAVSGERFGGFAAAKWTESGRYAGTPKSFVFSLQSSGVQWASPGTASSAGGSSSSSSSRGTVHIFPWAGRSKATAAQRTASNRYFQYADAHGLGMGGGEHFAFYLVSMPPLLWACLPLLVSHFVRSTCRTRTCAKVAQATAPHSTHQTW